MRKIIGSLFQSLDGVIQAPGGPEEDQTGFAHGVRAKTNLRSVSVKRRVVGEPAALRPPIQQLHLEGADRAMGGRDPVQVPYAWPRSPRERRRATPPLAVWTIPPAG